MIFTGTIEGIQFDFVTGKTRVSFLTDDKDNALSGYDDLKDIDKLTIEAKKFRKKRSLDANAYFWVLCGKLAAKTGEPKEKVYRHCIRDIGDNFEVMPIKNEAVQRWIEIWQDRGIGWVCDNLGESKIEGYTNICSYYGSSTYDTKQMSRLIDSIIYECKQQGIETLTDEELSRLKEEWH